METEKRIELNGALKKRLLNAIIKGYIDLSEFPEIKDVANAERKGFRFLPGPPEEFENNNQKQMICH